MAFGEYAFGEAQFGGIEQGDTVLVIADSSHAHAADSPAITQNHVLAINDATDAHSADNVTISGIDTVLVIADALHDHDAQFINIQDVAPTAWTRKQKFTIDPTWVPGMSTHTWFVVKLVEENLQTMNPDALDVLADSIKNGGGDLYFTSDAQGFNRLPCDITACVTSGTVATQNLEVDVRLPSVSPSQPTSFWMWYGYSSGVQPGASEPYGSDETWEYYTTPGVGSDLETAYSNNVNFPTDFIDASLPENTDSDTPLQMTGAGHNHWADNVAFSGINPVIADAAHSHSADNVTITQNHVLAINDAGHGQSADNVVFSAFSLNIASTIHVTTSDNIAYNTGLVINGTTHSHTADNIAVGVNLTVAESTHSHAVDSITITQNHVLDVQDATHSPSSGEPWVRTPPGMWAIQETNNTIWTEQ